MGNYTDYFNRIGYKPVYFLGDRVFGYWNKIPFVGTVGSDLKVDDLGPGIAVLLDLPIFYNSVIHHTIFTKHADIKLLKNFD